MRLGRIARIVLMICQPLVLVLVPVPKITRGSPAVLRLRAHLRVEAVCHCATENVRAAAMGAR